MIAFPQINFHLTDQINYAFEHDCLRIQAPKQQDQSDFQEMISFCLTKSLTKLNIQTNTLDQKLTFDDLQKQNITSEQLYQWSASIDLIEQYEIYLISNQSSLSTYTFYNCTLPTFGPHCQYQFIYISDDNVTLNEIIHQFYQIEYEQTSLTCYTHLECDRGSKSFCLDWSAICDGYVDCINDQIDEKFCWKLQLNECEEDEYRCRNGQCISKQFFFDQISVYECLDRSDEFPHFQQLYIQQSRPPVIKLEDITCLQRPTLLGISHTSSCNFQHNELLKTLILDDKPTALSNICYFSSYCLFYTEKSFSLICKDICVNNRCISLMKETCPKLIITPSIPLAFGHIYVGYLREIKNYDYVRNPEYICWEENLCGGFPSNSTLIFFDNKTCRQIKDIPMTSREMEEM